MSSPQIFQPLGPLTSAWDDYIRLSSGGPGATEFPALITALQTNLQNVARHEVPAGGESGGDGAIAGSLSALHFPPYAAAELRLVADDAFGMNAQCFVRQKATNAEHDSTESYCAFLFEVSSACFFPLHTDCPSHLFRGVYFPNGVLFMSGRS